MCRLSNCHEFDLNSNAKFNIILKQEKSITNFELINYQNNNFELDANFFVFI